jgi:hypothetical protein
VRHTESFKTLSAWLQGRANRDAHMQLNEIRSTVEAEWKKFGIRLTSEELSQLRPSFICTIDDVDDLKKVLDAQYKHCLTPQLAGIYHAIKMEKTLRNSFCECKKILRNELLEKETIDTVADVCDNIGKSHVALQKMITLSQTLGSNEGITALKEDPLLKALFKKDIKDAYEKGRSSASVSNSGLGPVMTARGLSFGFRL